MSTFSQTILIGNLGDDPQTTVFEGGGKIVAVSLATTEHWKDKQTGEKKSLTEWHRVKFGNKLADIAEKYLKKGSKIQIVGKNVTRKWTDQNGVDRYTTEVRARDMTFLSSNNDQQTGSAVDAHQQKKNDPSEKFTVDDSEPDDLPF